MTELTPLLQALGLALVHFIWQGTIIVAATASVLRLCRHSSANLRYGIACLALACMAVVPVLTFVNEYAGSSASAEAPAFASARLARADVTPLDAGTARADSASRFADWADRSEAALPWIVGTWILGVVWMSTGLVGAWMGLARIRRRGRRRLSPVVAAALARVSDAMRFNRRIDVAESEMIDSPTVVGWLRPVLLMPVSLTTGLSPAELEGILAHELAHLRRLDHLVNGLQVGVETLLFYHPGVWWLSAEIRREREHCCDDAALAVVGDRLVYANALASLEERRHMVQALAVSAAGGDLLSRVLRILGGPMTPRHTSLALPWFGSALGLALMVTIGASAVPRAAASSAAPGAAGTGIVLESGPRRLAAAPAGPQSTPAPTEIHRLQVQLTALDTQFRSAVQSQDLVSLGRLVAGTFVSTDQNGIVDTKSSFLTRIAAGLRFERLSQGVQIDGDTAIVTGAESEIRGAARERILFTRVWKRTDGSWQLLSSTQFRDPRPAAIPGMTSAPAIGQPGRGTYAVTAVVPAVHPSSGGRAATSLPANAVRVGGSIKEPAKIAHVTPIYPSIAKAARVSGVVILEAVVDESGSIANLAVLRGHPMLDQAAIDAVQQWKYTPTTLNGVPVPVLMTVTVNFQLPDLPVTLVP